MLSLSSGQDWGVQPAIFSKTKYWEEENEKYFENKMQDMRWFYTSVYCRLGIRNWSLIGIFHPLSLFHPNKVFGYCPFNWE